MALVVHAGNARGEIQTALQQCRDRQMEAARAGMQRARKEIEAAERAQTQLLARGVGGAMPDLVLTHAEDHLMAAVIELNMGEELLALYERIHRLEEKTGLG